MSDEPKKLQYEPPRIADLSSRGVEGELQGYCDDGPYPYFSCVSGPSYNSSCTDGGNVDSSVCTDGAVHIFPACDTGSSAITGCVSGQNQNFG